MARHCTKQESSPAPGARPGRHGATSATPSEIRRPAAAPDTVGFPRAPWAASRGVMYARLQYCNGQTDKAWHGDCRQLLMFYSAETRKCCSSQGRTAVQQAHDEPARALTKTRSVTGSSGSTSSGSPLSSCRSTYCQYVCAARLVGCEAFLLYA